MYKRHCGRCAWSKRTALIRFPPFFANGQRAARMVKNRGAAHLCAAPRRMLANFLRIGYTVRENIPWPRQKPKRQGKYRSAAETPVNRAGARQCRRRVARKRGKHRRRAGRKRVGSAVKRKGRKRIGSKRGANACTSRGARQCRRPVARKRGGNACKAHRKKARRKRL